MARGHAALDAGLAAIEKQAADLRTLGEAERARNGQRQDPGHLWLAGPYTERNRDGN